MGFTSDDGDHNIYKLHGSIFGLMHASRSWINVIKKFDFIKIRRNLELSKGLVGG